MELSKGLGQIGRIVRFLFIFLITNYIFVMLLLQAGDLPFLRQYESTSAVVMRTYAEESKFASGDGYEGTRWCPRVEYKYTVNGQLFISERVQPIVHCKSRQAAVALISHYPVGSQIQVWYSTDNHGYAVIDKSIPTVVYFFFGGLSIAWMTGNFLAFISLRKTALSSKKRQ